MSGTFRLSNQNCINSQVWTTLSSRWEAGSVFIRWESRCCWGVAIWPSTLRGFGRDEIKVYRGNVACRERTGCSIWRVSKNQCCRESWVIQCKYPWGITDANCSMAWLLVVLTMPTTLLRPYGKYSSASFIFELGRWNSNNMFLP